MIETQLLKVCWLSGSEIECDCRLRSSWKMPNVTVHTQGAKLTFSAYDYLMPVDQQKCRVQIRPSQRKSVTAFMRFGSVLLNKYDVVLDQERRRIGVDGERMQRVRFSLEFWIYFVGDAFLIVTLSAFHVALKRVRMEVTE